MMLRFRIIRLEIEMSIFWQFQQGTVGVKISNSMCAKWKRGKLLLIGVQLDLWPTHEGNR